jgi:hypothetical protein
VTWFASNVQFARNLAGNPLWAHPMELIGNLGQVEGCSGLFGDNVNIGARLVHGLVRTYHRLKNYFGCT